MRVGVGRHSSLVTSDTERLPDLPERPRVDRNDQDPVDRSGSVPACAGLPRHRSCAIKVPTGGPQDSSCAIAQTRTQQLGSLPWLGRLSPRPRRSVYMR